MKQGLLNLVNLQYSLKLLRVYSKNSRTDTNIQIIHPADVPSIAICVNNILIQFNRISRSAEPHHNSLFSKIAMLIM